MRAMVGTVTGIGTGPASDAEDSPPPPSAPAPVVRGPALVVLGLAVLIVVVGLVAAAISSGSGSRPGASNAGAALGQVTLADGTVVHLVPATTALRSLEGQGDPPPDIIGHLAVPSGSRPTGTVNEDLSAGLYDQTAKFATPQVGDDVVQTYRTALPRLGWKVIFDGPGVRNGRSGDEVLAKRGSSDGYEWEVGVVVLPTTAAGTTPFSIEVFELSGVT
jgi:hypothetical protein